MATTLLQLRTRARERADMVGSTFCSDPEINNWLNLGLAELYDMTVNAYEDYYTTSTTLTISSGNSAALPETFYKLRALDFNLNGQWVELTQFNFNERNRSGSGEGYLHNTYTGRKFRIMGDNILITPTDAAIGSYRLWYVPLVTTLSADASTIPRILSDSKWDEYIVLYAAERMLSKEESSIVDVTKERAEIANRVTLMSPNRQVDASGQVTDIGARQGWDWG